MDKIKQLILQEVRKKKILSGLAENIIKKEIDLFFKRNPKILKELEAKTEKDLTRLSIFSKIIKEIRRNLHKSYGAFQQSTNKREKLFRKGDYLSILKTNLSTKERLSFYNILYKRIFSITSNPKSILDLGSGLNPFSFSFMNIKEINYLSTEINQTDVDLLNSFFYKEKIKGKAIIFDLTEESSLKKLKELSKVDICLMFKLFDSLEFTKKRKYKLIEKILASTKSTWIVVSFATKTLSEKKMRFPERKWFESMLQRLKKEFTKIEFENEIFYIIKN